jgi:hypothetical protein
MSNTKKIQIRIDQVCPNLYYDLEQTGFGKIFNSGTDSEYIEFTISKEKEKKKYQNDVIIHKNQKTIYDISSEFKKE